MTSSTPAVSLHGLGRELLSAASDAPSGRAARNLLPGSGHALTQTLLALVAGTVLADHATPGPASLQVLAGTATLTTDDSSCTVRSGHWVTVPDGAHGLRAIEDLVCLLTVVVPR